MFKLHRKGYFCWNVLRTLELSPARLLSEGIQVHTMTTDKQICSNGIVDAMQMLLFHDSFSNHRPRMLACFAF